MKLIDLAKVIRSKNAGPTTLTLDILFNDEAGYQRALNSPSLQPQAIAPLYGLKPEQVELIPYAPAMAIKISMDRKVVAGNPGDRDVYGAQQHGPLLEIEI
ncbi:MAG: DUF4387 domain-containing protein [Betaproteobacteria bacterium]|nr:DUF4387 domain-containing protein [Betaproteobacteria bacterium]